MSSVRNQRNKSVWTEEDSLIAYNLYREGKSVSVIAKDLSCTIPKVNKMLDAEYAVRIEHILQAIRDTQPLKEVYRKALPKLLKFLDGQFPNNGFQDADKVQVSSKKDYNGYELLRIVAESNNLVPNKINLNVTCKLMVTMTYFFEGYFEALCECVVGFGDGINITKYLMTIGFHPHPLNIQGNYEDIISYKVFKR